MNEPSLVPYPAYSNQGTFLRCRRGTIDDVEPGMVTVVGVPQDTTAASRPGARWGPASIRAASAGLDYFLRSTLSGELVDVETGGTFSYRSEVPLMDMGDVMTYPLDMERTVQSVSTDIGVIVARGGLPVGLAAVIGRSDCARALAAPAGVTAEASRRRQESSL